MSGKEYKGWTPGRWETVDKDKDKNKPLQSFGELKAHLKESKEKSQKPQVHRYSVQEAEARYVHHPSSYRNTSGASPTKQEFLQKVFLTHNNDASETRSIYQARRINSRGSIDTVASSSYGPGLTSTFSCSPTSAFQPYQSSQSRSTSQSYLGDPNRSLTLSYYGDPSSSTTQSHYGDASRSPFQQYQGGGSSSSSSYQQPNQSSSVLFQSYASTSLDNRIKDLKLDGPFDLRKKK